MFGRTHNTITLAEVLRGTTPGRIQSVGYMQVIPLSSDISDDRFMSPADDGARISTAHYGTLVFENSKDAILIVPCHAGYVVKRAGQDHAMCETGLVQSRASGRFDTAMCVQQTQAGLIATGEYRMLILPFALRERALDLRKRIEFGKLWPAIQEFNAALGISGPSHLEYFLDRFGRELDQFVAEFECVPGQVGAIVLVDDEVVGVERGPSHAYWRSVWPCLIRECYGSLALQVARSRTEKRLPPATRVPLPEDLGSLEELGRAVEEIAAEEDRRTKEIVRSILDVPLDFTSEPSIEGLTLDTLAAGRFVGQVVRDGERPVYASILAARTWLNDRLWAKSKPFAL